MSEQENLPLGARGKSSIPYPGIRQTLDTCVLASIGGAVNHLVRKEVWTEESLFKATRATGASGATFGNVVPAALASVADVVGAREHLDGEERAEPLEDFVRLLRQHVDGGGLAIVSLQLATRSPTGFQRQEAWHMLTLIGREGNLYHIWDSNDIHTVVTEQELFRLPYTQGCWLIEHDRHHALLLWRKGEPQER
jgi:hypothetical protein